MIVLLQCLLPYQFCLVGIYFLDGVVGILISIWIIKTEIILFLESYKVLMDTSIDSSIKNEIIEKVLRYQQVKKVSEFYSVLVGYKFVIVIAIDVNGKISTVRSHKIADDIEKS